MIANTGKLVAIDGLDGSGKSTQVSLLVKRLRKEYPSLKILVTREPWDVEHNKIGKKIREILMLGKNKQVWANEEGFSHESLQYLFFLDRCVHYMKVITPALQKGYLVITDRERMVTYSYGYGAGVPIEVIKNWHEGIFEPDVYYYVKTSAKNAYMRISGRNSETKQKREIFETKEMLQKNEKSFNHIANEKVVNNLAVINGDNLPEVVSAEIYKDLTNKFGEWLSEFKKMREVVYK